jgi:hypothetical protein
MSTNKVWHIHDNGDDYEIRAEYRQFSGGHKVTVNGIPVGHKRSFIQGITGMDQILTLGTKEAHLVMIGNRADLAVDGVYLDSGEPYLPLLPMPRWNWVFIVLCFIIPVLSLGGVVPVLIAFMGAYATVKVSVKRDMGLFFQLLLSTLITAGAWILFLAFVIAIA